MAVYLEALEEHRDELDSLNVYPVPDGDTGTNLVHTQRAVVAALAALPAADPSEDLRATCAAISHASLLAARGNSGVILAQIVRGVCDVLVSAPDGDGGAVLAEALANASREASRAVADPQAGTVLTVLDEAARGAAAPPEPGRGYGATAEEVADVALATARRSLAGTRETLPALRQAGVVDAGGLGFVLLLDAFRATLLRTNRIVAVGPRGPVGDPARIALDVPGQGGYEVQFVLRGTDEHAQDLVGRLGSIGVSLSVSDGDGLHAVHIHTNEPVRVLEAARAVGPVSRETVVPLGPAVVTGLVALADAPGVVAALASIGAVVVTPGPERDATDMDLVRALDHVRGSRGAVVLAERGDPLRAAERAAASAGRPVRVVGAGSVPALLAAATAHHPARDLETNAAAMAEAAASCAAGEVSEASAPSFADVGDVRAGDWVATHDGHIVVVGRSAAEAAVGLVARLVRASPYADVLTVILGEGATPATDAVIASLRQSHPGLSLHPVTGGPAGSRYLIGVG